MNKHNINRPGYKHTNIGWIPEDWNLQSLDRMGSFLKGSGISKIELKKNGLPCIRYGELYTHHNFFIKKFYSFIDKSSAENSKILKKGDILFAGSGETLTEIGKCAAFLEDIEAYAGGDIIIFRSNKSNSKYLGFLLNQEIINRQKYKLGQGHSVVHIYPNNLKKILIPLPPLPEQKKIAEILSAWDEAIEKTQKLIQAKERRKKGLMQQLLTGKKRLPGFNGKWMNMKFKEFLIPTSYPFPKPNTPYTALGIRSHGKGTLLREVNDPKKVAMDILYEVKENELIINITFAWEGAAAILKKSDEGKLVSHRFPTFKFNQKKVISDYFRNIIITKHFVFYMGLISPGGAGRNRVLDKTDFLLLTWDIPPLPEQQAIASILSTADEEITLLKKKLYTLKEQKKGLMQKLLTGEVRVKV